MGNDIQNGKPPIGVKPYYVAAKERIAELTEAMVRFYREDKCNNSAKWRMQFA